MLQEMIKKKHGLKPNKLGEFSGWRGGGELKKPSFLPTLLNTMTEDM